MYKLRPAIICPEDESEAEEVLQFLITNDGKIDFLRSQEHALQGAMDVYRVFFRDEDQVRREGKPCFRVDADGRINYSGARFYDCEFRWDYNPTYSKHYIPDEMFLLSADEYIAACTGIPIAADFDVAGEDEFLGLLC